MSTQRAKYHAMIEAPEILDYGAYLNCHDLLSCQKPLEALCNADELQFQIVHQVEELWMKLMAYTLVEILDYLDEGHTNRIVTLMGRVHRLQRLMISQLDILETMSPKEYQEIRLQLGNGSGQESPGFRTLLKMPPDLWKGFEEQYLKAKGLTVPAIYHDQYTHCDSYVVAEALLEFDELFQLFRWRHLYLIHRTIGMGSSSLKGRSVDLLQAGAKQRFFPQLWDIRQEMTNRWGGDYGKVRPSIASPRVG